MTNDVLDVAIVGGGVAGVYSGWRLLGADAPAAEPRTQRRVALFEMSGRVGGRLLSVKPPGMPHVTCELGGMRYISTQSLCRSLVENVLQLGVHDFPTDLPGNLCYLRNTRLRVKDLNGTGKVPYNLADAEVGLDPGALLLFALRQLVPGIDRMSDAQFDDVYRNFTIDGRHLYDLGFWNLLLRVVSAEAYELIQDSSGYYSITTNWNAGDALRMCLGDFAPGITYHGLNDGFESVPRALCDRFIGAGGTVHTGHRLVSFDRTSLPDGATGVRLELIAASGPLTVLARHLVLAMPRRSLQLLSPTGCLLDPKHQDVHDLIDSVEGIPLFKVFMAYHTPWWETVGVTAGRSTTTLPLRQCYYWGVEGRQPGAEADNQNAVLLASYDDVRETFFWSGLEGAASFHPDLFPDQPNRFVSSWSDGDAWRCYRAPRLMVEETHRQLMSLHGVRYAPAPYAAAYRNWREDPFGGGVHFWNIGYNSLDCIPRMVKPVSDAPVYVVGEAYSRTQGWVEGALETSEIMLQSHFHLRKPSWVTPPAPAPAPAA
ncbi:MAG TPA: FAD-dependent oxidoreductase [Gemmatimonadaceae bacterium]|nr:FAD-dependent oxidoreductase [Gemmatimonadaceae bacterium]